MKSKFGKLFSIVFCLSIVISMLAIGAVSASASVTGPDDSAKYMYKFERNNIDEWSNIYYLKTTEVTFAEGEVYRLSFYYKAQDGSVFPNGNDMSTPLDFSLRYGTNDYYSFAASKAVIAPVDPDWYYMQYDLTVEDSLIGAKLINFTFHTLYKLSKPETVYIADIKLCKVDGDKVGETLIPDICAKDTLENWYTGATNSADGKSTTKMDDNGNVLWKLSIEPIDKELFKRPDVSYKVTVNGGTIVGDRDTYKPGEEVKVKADKAAAGKVFDYWAAKGVSLTSPGEEEITFIMPDGEVTLTANWEDSDEPSDDDGKSDIKPDDDGKSDAKPDDGKSDVKPDDGKEDDKSPETGVASAAAAFGVLACAALAVTAATARKKA